jgi:putative ABC transport system ATP-binding protein
MSNTSHAARPGLDEAPGLAVVTETPIIQAIDVTKVYGGGQVRALDGASLHVRVGEWVAISGPSGSGKSTLLALLAALDRATSGSIVVDGMDLSARRHVDTYRRRVVGLVFQLHNLLPHLDARGNIMISMFGTHRSRAARQARADHLLAEVHLTDKRSRRPPEMSGGERQRLAIARALANEPSILLADEPTGSLDPTSAGQTIELFRRLRDEHGTTIVMVTHDREMAAAADRMVVIESGRIVE